MIRHCRIERRCGKHPQTLPRRHEIRGTWARSKAYPNVSMTWFGNASRSFLVLPSQANGFSFGADCFAIVRYTRLGITMERSRRALIASLRCWCFTTRDRIWHNRFFPSYGEKNNGRRIGDGWLVNTASHAQPLGSTLPVSDRFRGRGAKPACGRYGNTSITANTAHSAMSPTAVVRRRYLP